MSTQAQPDAMQSKQNTPPTERVASPIALMYSSGSMMPVLVSTCGAHTKAGRSVRIASRISESDPGEKLREFSVSEWSVWDRADHHLTRRDTTDLEYLRPPVAKVSVP
jgi:hypothetical protein